MLTREKIREMARSKRDTVEVNVVGVDTPIMLRHPTFKEWMDLIRDARESAEGGGATAEQLAKVLAVCLSDGDGDRMFKPGDVADILALPPDVATAIHDQCWKTVLKVDLEQAEKN